MMHDFITHPGPRDLHGPAGVLQSPESDQRRRPDRLGRELRRADRHPAAHSGTNDDISWFEIDPCYVFHAVNAFSEGSKVTADVGRHEYMWRDSMDDFAPSHLYRWTFDLETGEAKEEQLDDASHGFPRVDDRVVGLPYRYAWAVGSRPDEKNEAIGGTMIRYDLKTGTSAVHDFGEGRHPGEFAFVEASPTAAEDEGWALGFVYDKASDKSELVILDGTNPAAPPVARVHLPARVPFGFHGSWIKS